MQNKYTEASNNLTELKGQYFEIGDIAGVAECMHSLGDILYMQDKYTEASALLLRLESKFFKIGYVMVQPNVYKAWWHSSHAV